MGRLHVERQDDHPIHNNLSRKVVPANTGCSRLRKHRADDGKRKCPGDYAKTDLFRDPGTWIGRQAACTVVAGRWCARFSASQKASPLGYAGYCFGGVCFWLCSSRFCSASWSWRTIPRSRSPSSFRFRR